MSADLDPHDVAEVRRRVVLPVARSLISEDELDDAKVVVEPATPFWRLGDGVLHLSVAVRACGEWVHLSRRWPVDAGTNYRWDAESFADEVYDNLVDEIAESQFAWGELRTGDYEVLPPLSS